MTDFSNPKAKVKFVREQLPIFPVFFGAAWLFYGALLNEKIVGSVHLIYEYKFRFWKKKFVGVIWVVCLKCMTFAHSL